MRQYSGPAFKILLTHSSTSFHIDLVKIWVKRILETNFCLNKTLTQRERERESKMCQLYVVLYCHKSFFCLCTSLSLSLSVLRSTLSTTHLGLYLLQNQLLIYSWCLLTKLSFSISSFDFMSLPICPSPDQYDQIWRNFTTLAQWAFWKYSFSICHNFHLILANLLCCLGKFSLL